MTKHDKVKLIVKILLYIITAIAGVLGIESFASCTVQHTMSTSGKGLGIFHYHYTDTFQVEHGNDIKLRLN